MDKKYFRWGIVVIVVLAAFFLVWWAFHKGNSVIAPTNSQEKQTGETNEQSGNVMELSGVLKIADDPEKGNLMLVPAEGNVIYLNTTRDFKALLNKDVKVSIDGDSRNFRLIDIVAK